MFLRRRTPSRSWSRYLQEMTHKKLNSCRRMTTTTMTMRMEKKKGDEAEDEDDEDYTPLNDFEKDKIYHNANEIKTARNESPIPTGRLRDLLNRIDMTTPPEFKIMRFPRPG
jgi:hypothetical protein